MFVGKIIKNTGTIKNGGGEWEVGGEGSGLVWGGGKRQRTVLEQQ